MRSGRVPSRRTGAILAEFSKRWSFLVIQLGQIAGRVVVNIMPEPMKRTILERFDVPGSNDETVRRWSKLRRE